MSNYFYIEYVIDQEDQVDSNLNPEDMITAEGESQSLGFADLFHWGLVEDIGSRDKEHRDSRGRSLLELIEHISTHDLPVVLVIPGEKVVVQKVDYDLQQKRHFKKMLPYTLEDNVVSDVENLHFSTGIKQDPYAIVAHVNDEWFGYVLDLLARESIEVDYCFADFQRLVMPNVGDYGQQCVCWLKDNRIQVHTDNGRGFSVSMSLAPLLLKSFFEEWIINQNNIVADTQSDNSNKEQQNIIVYIHVDHNASDEEYTQVKSLFDNACPIKDCLQYSREEPLLSYDNSHHKINFCTDKYRKKLSSKKQIKEYKVLALFATAAIIAFLCVNFFDIYQKRQQNLEKTAAIEAAYRAVIPRGVVNDPVRQLASKLGVETNNDKKSAQVVLLMSRIAPLANQLSIDLSTINYSRQENSMRISIQVGSFSVVEQLKNQLANNGLITELLSSNATDEGFQARLRIAMEGGR